MAANVNVEENKNIKQVDDTPEDTASELLVKHPLENCWALWFFKSNRNLDWASNLKQITKFNTVEDFWAVYNHTQRASKIPNACDYYLFKEGIQPMWEDDQNKNGGRWLINLDRNQRGTHLDTFWLELMVAKVVARENWEIREKLLCLVGEAFGDDSDCVCGAVVNIRNRGDKINLWTRHNKENAILSIGRVLKERLNIPDKVQIGYNTHKESISKTSSSVKNMFTL